MTPRSALNRTLLALVGLILIGGGLLILFAGLDLYRRHHLIPPVGWPLSHPADVLLSSADRARWSSQGWWWWPAVIAALALAALLALWWLLAQLSRHRPGPRRYTCTGGRRTTRPRGAPVRRRYLRYVYRDEAPQIVDKERGWVSAHYFVVTHPLLQWFCRPADVLARLIERRGATAS